MKARLGPLALVLLACGCQKPALIATAIVPPSTPTPAVELVQPAPGTAFQIPTATPMQPMQNASTGTVAFLQALARTIEQKRSLDAEVDKVYFQLLLDQRQKDLENFGGAQPARGTATSAGQVMAQTATEQERRTGVLFTTLLQTPPPPDCRNLLALYRDLLQAQAKRSQQQALYLQSMERDPQSVFESMREQHNQDTERFRDEQEQRRAGINAEIERIRNSTPDIAAQVPPFSVHN